MRGVAVDKEQRKDPAGSDGVQRGGEEAMAPPEPPEFHKDEEDSDEASDATNIRWWSDLPDLATARMQWLNEEGFTKGDGTEYPPAKDYNGIAYVKRKPVIEEARPVRLDNGQTIWVEIAGRIAEQQKHQEIKVFDKPSSSDSAS